MGCGDHKLPFLLDKSAGSGFSRSESVRRVLGGKAQKYWVGSRGIKILLMLAFLRTNNLRNFRPFLLPLNNFWTTPALFVSAQKA